MPLTNPSIINKDKISVETANFSVQASNTTTVLLAGNEERRGATIFNNSLSDLYISFSGTASFTSYAVKLAEGAYYEVPFNYVGFISGIWFSADIPEGQALAWEFR